MKDLILRLLFIPVTTIFLIGICQYIYPFFSQQIYLFEPDYETRRSIFHFLEIVFTASIFLWIFCLFISEILAYFAIVVSTSRLLKHLRYAPIAVYAFAMCAVPISDQLAIEYSKYQIRNYVYANSDLIEEPKLKLHNNYRHWCGNGAIGWQNYLYFETASEGFEHENPHIRARALLMSSKVNNAWNGGDERFDKYLKDSCRDQSRIVFEIANKYLEENDSNCKTYILK